MKPLNVKCAYKFIFRNDLFVPLPGFSFGKRQCEEYVKELLIIQFYWLKWTFSITFQWCGSWFYICDSSDYNENAID